MEAYAKSLENKKQEYFMKPTLNLPALLLCFAVPVAWSAEPLNFEDETTRISYSLGYQIGGDFKRQKVDMNAEAVVQGIHDALASEKPQMSMAEMQSTLIALKNKVVVEQKAERKLRESEALAAGKKFLEENASKEGVVTTDSGLQYKVLKEGTGASPESRDKVTVNYRGTKIDGVEFDSSSKRGKPATFQLDSVIRGWGEGLQLMKEGGKMQLFIPHNLAYRNRGPLAHQTLIFEVELLKVEKVEAEAAPDAGGKKAE